jgi:hypothetical protein
VSYPVRSIVLDGFLLSMLSICSDQKSRSYFWLSRKQLLHELLDVFHLHYHRMDRELRIGLVSILSVDNWKCREDFIAVAASQELS